MDVSDIFDDLNDPQREAVAAPPGSLLVLAGAGSGKTRVLTCRVAWLVKAYQVSPMSVLAVTFTNKASREMRGRIEKMLGFSLAGMWIGTFHGLSHRLLRAHWQEAGLSQNFEILDSDDQLRLVRRVLRELSLDEAHWQPRQVQWFINGHKDNGRRARHLTVGNDIQQQRLHHVYETYEKLCESFGVVDFAELLLRAFELLQNNEPLRERYQERFQHVLVDEFQDTNSIQYRWLKLIAGKHNNLFVVGDDDQSIYGWRGAKVENILKFEQDYPGTTTIRLEQNYRSTGNILKVANSIINHNQGRLGKKLWTDFEDGEAVQLYAAFNETDEARFVIERAQEWIEAGNPRASIAILYRSNAQSRVFEEILLDVGVPYRVYGGLRFFERAEIKDALAYLRLLSNRDSDPAFERIVNVPTRGIGAKTLARIREQATALSTSLWDAAIYSLQENVLPPRASHALQGFVHLVESMKRESAGMDLEQLAELVLKKSGLIDHFRKEKGERAEAKVENLEELVSATRNFRHDPDEDLDILSSFLAHAALEAGEGQADEWEDCVQLMSLHSAKGLEFPLVFLCGLEEGLFPHARSLEERGRLEEERRLCYVGMTRAMRQLYICYAEVRRLHGRENYTTPSRFIREIPTESIVEVRSPGLGGLTKYQIPASPEFSEQIGADTGEWAQIKLGTRVRHASFGDGIILNLEGQGEYARVQVNFEGAGSKWLVLAYAKLEAL